MFTKLSNRQMVHLFSLIAVLSLFSCSMHQVTQTNFSKIQTGMSEQEVIAILGEPTKSTGMDVDLDIGSIINLGKLSGNSMFWQGNDGAVITVQFLNGKVRAKAFTNQF